MPINAIYIINFLLTSLARYVQRNIGPRSFCTNLTPVQKRLRSDISLHRPRVRLIRSYSYTLHVYITLQEIQLMHVVESKIAIYCNVTVLK